MNFLGGGVCVGENGNKMESACCRSWFNRRHIRCDLRRSNHPVDLPLSCCVVFRIGRSGFFACAVAAVHSVPDIQSIEEQVTFHALLVDWHYRGTSSIFSIYALSYNQSQHYFDYNRWVGYPEQRSMMVDDFYRNMI